MLINKKIVLLTTLCLCEYVSNSKVNSSDWDILIFTQQWPMTVCLQWKEKYSHHTCNFPDLVDIWTIHGIWPTKLHTIGPAFCDPHLKFSENEIKPLERPLQMYWTNIENGTAPFSLWSHEWNKHGTCVAQLFGNELNYFKQGLQWISQYEMATLLSKKEILPQENGYEPLLIWQSIRDSIGKNPGIQCYKDKEHGVQYLYEIQICFDKGLNLIDCDGIENEYLGNCKEDNLVLYPSYKPETENFSRGPKAPWLLDLIKTLQFIQWFTL